MLFRSRLGDHFTDLRLAQHPQAGHFVHLEQPDDAAAAVGGFLDRLVW